MILSSQITQRLCRISFTTKHDGMDLTIESVVSGLDSVINEHDAHDQYCFCCAYFPAFQKEYAESFIAKIADYQRMVFWMFDNDNKSPLTFYRMLSPYFNKIAVLEYVCSSHRKKIKNHSIGVVEREMKSILGNEFEIWRAPDDYESDTDTDSSDV